MAQNASEQPLMEMLNDFQDADYANNEASALSTSWHVHAFQDFNPLLDDYQPSSHQDFLVNETEIDNHPISAEAHDRNLMLQEADDNEDPSEDEAVDFWVNASVQNDTFSHAFGTSPFSLGHDHGNLTSKGDEMARDRASMEDDFDFESGRVKKKRKLKHAPKSYLTDITRRLLGLANKKFLERNYTETTELLKEIIRLCPRASEAYHTMGMIHEEQGDMNKALMLYMVAAHLKPSDVSLWQRVTFLSKEAGMLKEASYCLMKAVQAAPNDEDLLWERALLLEELGESTRAASIFAKLLKLRPHDLAVVKEIARIHVELNDSSKAVYLIEHAIMECVKRATNLELSCIDDLWCTNVPSTSSRTKHLPIPKEISFDYINITAELYMINEEYGRAAQMIQKSIDENERSGGGDSTVSFAEPPVDLSAKLAICQVHLGNVVEAKETLKPLLTRSVETYADLYLDLADAFLKQNHPTIALPLYQRLLMETSSGEYDSPAVWARVAECQQLSGDLESALKSFQRILKHNPNLREIKIAMAELAEQSKDFETAFELRKELSMQQRRHLNSSRSTTLDNAATTADSTSTSQPLSLTALVQAKQIRASEDDIILRFNSNKEKQHRQFYDRCVELCNKNAQKYLNAPHCISKSQHNPTTIPSHSEPLPAWIKVFFPLARSIILDFQMCDRFFPSNRMHSFRPKRKGAKSVKRKVTRPLTATTPPCSASSVLSRDEDHNGEDRWESDGSDHSNSLPPQLDGNDSDSSVEDAHPGRSGAFVEEFDFDQSLEYFGLCFDEWIDINVKFALILNKMATNLSASQTPDHFVVHPIGEMEHLEGNDGVNNQNIDDSIEKEVFLRTSVANQVLQKVSSCSMVYCDFKRQFPLKMLLLGQLWDSVLSVCRWVILSKPMSPDPYKLYHAAFLRGDHSSTLSIFSRQTSLKFFRRHLAVVGYDNPHVLTLTAHILSSSRSFRQASVLLTRAWHVCPEDPMINLSLGITHLHRAIQRKTNNRHGQIVLAFSFLSRYYQIRESACGERRPPTPISPIRTTTTSTTTPLTATNQKNLFFLQEALYNFGRAFHTINAVHLAVYFYQRVLELSKQMAQYHCDTKLLNYFDIGREAAYNLSLIYYQSGSLNLANEIMRKHLVF